MVLRLTKLKCSNWATKKLKLKKAIMDYPKISVITPSYNQGRFIEETIQSVLNQNYPNYEYIIIDGGSTDNSGEIIKKYEDRVAYWVSEPDKGQADALNKGFKIAAGEIIGWLNSDDLYVRNALHIIGESFLRYPEMGLIYGNCYNINENSEVIKISHDLPFVPLVWKLGGLFFCQPAGFFKREVLENIGYLNTDLEYSMDKDYFYRMLRNKIGIKHIPKFIAKFRFHDSSKTVADKLKMRKAVYDCWLEYFGLTNSLMDKYIYSLSLFVFKGLRYGNNILQCYFDNKYFMNV